VQFCYYSRGGVRYLRCQVIELQCELFMVGDTVAAETVVVHTQPLSQFTSLGVGGDAEHFCEPYNTEQLSQAIAYAKLNEWPLVWLGGGSNVLVHDRGIPGLVLRLANKFANIIVEDKLVIAEAGVSLPRLVKLICKSALLDISYCAGIPGTCGGAVYMNAGTKNGEISQKIAWVELLNPETGELEIRKPQQMEFAYRTSILYREPLIVTRVAFSREDGDGNLWWEKARSQVARRKQLQPQGVRNAGSFFRNPPGQVAGVLIERAGLKETQIGDAMVSLAHSNFLVNVSQATSDDFVRLIRLVRKRVFEEFGVRLALEVCLLGFSEE
jgi:UDP-N-acetylmuramate dehydrogenase